MARETGQVELKDTESEPAYWGNVLEEVVVKEFQERTGKKFVVEIKSSNIRSILLRANIDREVVRENAILECKTANQFLAKRMGRRRSAIELSLPSSALYECFE